MPDASFSFAVQNGSGRMAAMRSLAACLAVLALVLAPCAGAHPFFEPGFAPQGAEARLVVVLPNERRVPMTELELSVPDGVKVVAAESSPPWRGSVDGGRASWTGGRVPPLTNARVVVRLSPTGEPGATTFHVRQRFADGTSVDWPMELTVTPGLAGDADGDGGIRGVAFAAVGIAAAVTVGFVLWFRRRPS
jgi:hypothetical protein